MNDLFDKGSGKKILKNVLSLVQKFQLLEKGDSVLIALSGGADSVFLTYLLCKLRELFFLNLSICHINHNLRGEESIRDEAFCRELADQLNIPFYLSSVDVHLYSKKNKLSLEEAARELRYEIFTELVKEKGFNKVALAHNLDDLSETLFYRLCKGTGVGGLISIPVRRKLTEHTEIIRPLLFVKKSEILNFLSENKMKFVFDSSNKDNKFSRNYIRNKISPLFEKKFPLYKEKIKDLYLILWEEERYWNHLLSNYDNFVLRQDDKIILDKSIKEEDIVIQRRMIRKLVSEIDYETFLALKTVDKIIGFKGKGTKIVYENKNLKILSIYGNLCFEKKLNLGLEKIDLDIKDKKSIKFLNFLIKFDFEKNIKYNDFKSSVKRAFFNAESKYLRLRNYEKGDKIKIFKDKTKKLSDIFVDEKIPKIERKKALVVCNEKNEIVLVLIPEVFLRVSFDFYVDDKTEKIGVINVEKIS